MTEGITANLNKLRFDSDVILLTENAEDNKLYANKSVLSEFSPVMRAMFNGDFKEANQNSVKIHVDYEAMKEILRILLHIKQGLAVELPRMYASKRLMELYKAADYLDISIIRKMCIEQFRLRPSVDTALLLLELGEHDILREMVKKMNKNELERFLCFESSRRNFSKKDVASIFEKLAGYDCTASKRAPGIYFKMLDGATLPTPQKLPTGVLDLLNVAPIIVKPRIDLTKKWIGSDVAFLATQSQGLLYANRGTLASVSQHFRKMFFDEEMELKEIVTPFIATDYNYATVKTILSIIHHCNADFDSSLVYHVALLCDMYRVAAKDHLDIPMIQEFCIARLRKQGDVQCLEVAIKLNLPFELTLIGSMRADDLASWLTPCDKCSYRDGDKVIDISLGQMDPVLSLNQVRTVINKLMCPSEEEILEVERAYGIRAIRSSFRLVPMKSSH